jgi:hypothetical protein
MLFISYHTVYDRAPAQYPVTVEAVAPNPVNDMPGYYRVTIGKGDIALVMTDAHRKQLIDALASAPDLPKSDAQIDAEAEPPDPMEHQKTRNAAVAEPLRSVVNAMSPHVGGEDAPF